jgi:DNA replicative helicase MCM subunit Mcm2 (Cdc46/Mcm family)
MDKLVSIKGLVIRATPIIPDMKEGKSIHSTVLVFVS